MSSFSPTPAELDLVNKLFAVADPQKLGIVTGDKAVETFAGASLPPSVLGEIWSIADKENNGFLTRKGVAVALRLIGYAQKGEKVKETLLEKPAPLAHLKGISPTPSTLPSSPPKSPSSVGVSLHPPLTPEDKSKFLRLFLGCGPVNGLLAGDKARDVFVKSKLPVETLSQVWTLADTQDRGALDQTDFTIAMYLIQAIMSGQLKSLPATPPPGLYEQAGGRPPVGMITHPTGNSVSSLQPSLTGTFAPAVPATTPLTAQTTGTGSRRLQAQTTGQEYNRMSMAVPARQPSVHFASNPVAALGASAFGTAPQPPWDVTPEEKARFDLFFDSLDTQKRGFIEGEVAVPFMLQSKLSEDTLAQVWDLADLNNDGKLTRDGFAVAMHLIQGKLAGKEIPAALPLSLVPPAMRAGRVGGTAVAPSSAPIPAPVVPEPVRDLLWDDSPPASAASPPQQIVSAFGSPPSQGVSVLQPQMTGGLSQQPTGTGSPNPPPIPPRTTDPFGVSAFSPPTGQAHRDLLSDDEGTPSSAVPDNSAEIGNLQNQLNSTNKSLESTKAERQTTETTLATQASQLSALQTQLTSAKAAYETEMKLLETLRERYAAQTKDIAQTREQLIRAESDLSAVRVEKAEVEGSLLRDKEEVRELQRRMKEVSEESEHTKIEIEKSKKETKHQKGLLAIAKKQLATREVERAKLAKELEDAKREAHAAREELEKTEAELAKEPASIQTNGVASPVPTASGTLRMDTPSIAAQQPLPGSPPPSIGSPSSMNPFERLMMQTTGSRPASPPTAPTSDIFSVSSPQIQQTPADTTQFPPLAVSASSGTAPKTPKEAHVVAAESSTSTAPRSSLEDPFGVVNKASSATSIEEAAEKAAPRATDIASPSPPAETQPTMAPVETPGSLPETPEKSASDALDNAARQFPALDIQSPAVLPASNEGHTDLDSKLIEKEQEESDNDSDNEGDFHDAKEARLSASSPIEEPRNDVTTGSASDAPKSPPGLNAFEDAFGLKEELKNETPVSGLSASKNTVTNLFFSEAQPTDKTLENGKTSESGSPFDNVPNSVNAFDEALGKISSPGSSSGAPQFQLDAGFEDTFDFIAAKDHEPLALSLPAPPTVNGSSQPSVSFASACTPTATNQDTATNQQEAAKTTFSFDDAFGSSSSSQGPPQPYQVSASDHGITFEDAFGGGTDRALALDFNPATSSSTHPGQPSEESMSHQIHSPPRSPRSPRVTTMQTSPSNIRPSSPGPRPRRSTGSSTEGSLHAKPPPQHRHSKLSLRLPFGRKDKKKPKNEPPPVPPQQFLSPVSEPQGAQTPAVEDDVEPVKQLCGMGFSRSQAVDALERHGYDVQRALNSLLGAA